MRFYNNKKWYWNYDKRIAVCHDEKTNIGGLYFVKYRFIGANKINLYIQNEVGQSFLSQYLTVENGKLALSDDKAATFEAIYLSGTEFNVGYNDLLLSIDNATTVRLSTADPVAFQFIDLLY